MQVLGVQVRACEIAPRSECRFRIHNFPRERMQRRLLLASGASLACAAAARTFRHAATAQSPPPPPDDTARLRRQSTRPHAYAKGQPFKIVRVPQFVGGVMDIGHVSVVVQHHDGAKASLGFYAKSYRRGLAGTLVTSDDGVLLSPDPLYLKATRNPDLKEYIVPLYAGTLTDDQAQRLNEWTDDETHENFELTRWRTAAGEDQERAVAKLEGERYVGAAMLLSGAENCARRAFRLKLASGQLGRTKRYDHARTRTYAHSRADELTIYS